MIHSSIFAACLCACGTAMAGTTFLSGYAHFGSVSDTIQILGNTQFGATYGTPKVGVGDFTYEMNIRIASGTNLGHIISEQRDTWEDKSMVISANGDYLFSAVSNDYTGNMHGNIAGMPVGDWMHLAYVKRDNLVTIYVNGNAVASHVPTFQYGDHAGSWMSIGMFRYGAGYIPTGAYESFLGDLDWIRVSAGAKYTGNFTAPSEADIAADATTQLLLRFNEAAGSSVLIDESANHFVCNMGVPVHPGVTATSPTLLYGAVPTPGAIALLGFGVLMNRRRR